MIIFLYQGTHRYTHKKLINQPGLGKIIVRSYQWLTRKGRLPKGCYIFIDRERMDQWELRVYGALYRHINQAGPAYRAVNDPARMLNRSCLRRSLYREGFNDFNAYLLTEHRQPER